MRVPDVRKCSCDKEQEHIDMFMCCCPETTPVAQAHISICMVQTHFSVCMVQAHFSVCMVQAHFSVCMVQAHFSVCMVQAHKGILVFISHKGKGRISLLTAQKDIVVHESMMHLSEARSKKNHVVRSRQIHIYEARSGQIHVSEARSRQIHVAKPPHLLKVRRVRKFLPSFLAPRTILGAWSCACDYVSVRTHLHY
jgi:hypothetical protein